MDIERKISGGRRLKRIGTLRRTNSEARRAAARAKVARAEAAGPTPLGMPGIIGTAIPINSLDLRRKFLTSVGSQYLERIRTARSSYFDEHPADRPGSALGMGRQPSLADLQIVGQQVPVVKTTVKRKVAAPKPSDEELAELTQRLQTRALEVEAVLRRDFTAGPDAMQDTRDALTAGLDFMDKLHTLAESTGHLAGTIFQELLARHREVLAAKAEAERKRAEEESKAKAEAAAATAASTPTALPGAGAGADGGAGAGAGAGAPASSSSSNVGHSAGGVATGASAAGFHNMSVVRGDRAGGRLNLEALTDVLTADRMVIAAQALCGMLRIKLEDDSDLGLARTVLEDSTGFFKDLVNLAKWKDMDVMVLLEELRMM